ncbi:MAG: hypothetical protein ACOZQL_21430 [Myxococcota bacterium]
MNVPPPNRQPRPPRASQEWMVVCGAVTDLAVAPAAVLEVRAPQPGEQGVLELSTLGWEPALDDVSPRVVVVRTAAGPRRLSVTSRVAVRAFDVPLCPLPKELGAGAFASHVLFPEGGRATLVLSLDVLPSRASP